MNKTGAALFVLAAIVAWFLWPHNAEPGDAPTMAVPAGEHAVR